jgi:hypothetical protein
LPSLTAYENPHSLAHFSPEVCGGRAPSENGFSQTTFTIAISSVRTCLNEKPINGLIKPIKGIPEISNSNSLIRSRVDPNVKFAFL